MSTTKKKIGGITAILLVFVLVLAGCPEDTEPDNKEDPKGELAISGLPSSDENYSVRIFGSDLATTWTAINDALFYHNYLAFGDQSSGNAFPLITKGTGESWKESGDFLVLLLNTYGTTANPRDPIYSYATVKFSQGKASTQFSNFTPLK